MGDSVDNVPGVPLVGPKKARALLESFETLEGVLDNADKAPGKKLSENLVTYRDQALMSRELVTLKERSPHRDGLGSRSPLGTESSGTVSICSPTSVFGDMRMRWNHIFPKRK